MSRRRGVGAPPDSGARPVASPLQPFKASSCCRGYSIPHERVALRGFVVFSLAARTFSLRAVDLLAGWRRACPLHVAKTVSGALASNNTVSRCGRHTFHHPATGFDSGVRHLRQRRGTVPVLVMSRDRSLSLTSALVR